MKRALKALIIGLCVLAFAFSGAVTALAQGSAGDAVPASETDGTSARTESLELFLPSSPEQFLPLNSPNDVAISDDYIAVADGNKIYVYDRAAQTYSTFTGTAGLTYSSLCFYDTYLFFVPSGSETYITYFDCAAIEGGAIGEESTQQLKDSSSASIPCSSFILNGRALYYATITSNTVSIFCRDLDPETLTAGERGDDLAPSNNANTAPYFTVYSGQVYFSLNTGEASIYSVDNSLATPRYTTYFSVYSFAISDSTCYYSSIDNNHYFYMATGSDGDKQLMDSDGSAISGVSAIEAYDGDLYLVTGASVKEYAPTSSAYTGWEIAQYSAGRRRLGAGADALSLQGSHLTVADPANRRVLLYNTDSEAYSSVSVSELGSDFFVCAGAENFLVCNSSVVRLYGYDGQMVTTAPQEDAFDGDILDCAYSYGAYYLLTNTGKTYRIANGTLDSAHGELPSSATAVTADIEGNLWVFSPTSNAMTCYTAEQFMGAEAIGEEQKAISFTQGETIADVLIDYAGNAYALTADSVLCKSTDSAENPISETPLGLSSFVSYADDAQAVAFAFGFETGDAYILTDSGFIVKWSYGIESLDNIAADGAYDALTGAAASDAYSGVLVTVSQDAVAVLLDESAFSADMQTLPTDGYARAGSLSDSANSGKPITGVRAFDILGVGTVVALYEYVPGQTEAGSDYVPTQRNYTLCLVLEGGLQSVEQDSYYTAETSVGYTTNAVGLYNLPLMRTGSAAYRLELPKGTQVTVLGRISCAASAEGGWGLDADHCFVSCTVDGQTVYGFLPAPYVSAAPPAGTAGSGTEDITFRYLKQQQITLSDGETLTILGTADEEGNVYATYEYRGVTYGGKVALSLLGEESVSGENTTRPLLEGSSVTLYNTERLTVYGGPDENGLVRVSYTLNGRNYTALISEDLLADASDFGTWVLVAVTIVTAAVLASACYLVLRKPPMITPPLSAEEAESGADGDGADGEADGADRPAEERERPSDDGEEE